MAFRSVNFWKNLSTRWSVHVLFAQQRPGNEMVILRGVSREWYLFEKDCGNERTTFLLWSWFVFILRRCSCTLLRIRKNGERALFSFFFGEGVVRLNAPGLSVVSSLLSVLNRTGSSSSKIKGLSLLKERKSVYFVHCPNRVQYYTRYCRWFRLLYLNRARVSPLWGTVTPQANMEVTLPHSGKNCGHRSVSSPFPFFRLWNYSVGARWKLRDHSKW